MADSSAHNPIKITEQFLFFWGGWPSQWFKAAFVVDNVTYNCCEQYMMAEKARVFGDCDTESRVLAASNPRAQKALGREVRHFDKDVWDSVCRGIVFRGNLARFEQNLELKNRLLETTSRVIVEASPNDRIWGIGMAQDDPDIENPSKWRGSNWLGIALVQVREELKRREGLPFRGNDSFLAEQILRREQLELAK